MRRAAEEAEGPSSLMKRDTDGGLFSLIFCPGTSSVSELLITFRPEVMCEGSHEITSRILLLDNVLRGSVYYSGFDA